MHSPHELAVLFLALSLCQALLTLNSWFPIRRSARLAAVSFLFGWLTAELALHHVVWEIAVAALFIHAGALSGWEGWLALTISLANWAALLFDYQSGWSARPVLRAALDEALGSGWRTRLRPELAARLTRVAWRQLLLPFPIFHGDVEAIRNVPFAEAGGRPLRLDVYRHKSRPTGTPTLVYVHGGAWVIGDKGSQGLPILHHLAAMGWTCFGVNYRLSPRATFPDPLVDVKQAIAWIRANGATYGANPDFIIISGGSAGGHLAALTTLTAGDKSFQPGFEGADCSVNGCVALYGVFDFIDRAKVWPHLGMIKLVAKHVLKSRVTKAPDDWNRASPIFWVSNAAPPFLLIHGTRDSMVPIAESRNFAAALRAVSTAPVALAEIKGAQHAFEIFPSPRAACTVEAIADFATAIYSRFLDARDGQKKLPEATAPLPLSMTTATAESNHA